MLRRPRVPRARSACGTLGPQNAPLVVTQAVVDKRGEVAAALLADEAHDIAQVHATKVPVQHAALLRVLRHRSRSQSSPDHAMH